MKNLKLLLKSMMVILTFALWGVNELQAQSKLGDNPTQMDASSLLELESSNKGLLISRMTNSQRDVISSPATGLMIFSTTDSVLQFNSGTPIAPIWTHARGIQTGNGAPTGTGNPGDVYIDKNDGTIYTSDGSAWTSAGSDNLGSHKATQTLDMDDQEIHKVKLPAYDEATDTLVTLADAPGNLHEISIYELARRMAADTDGDGLSDWAEGVNKDTDADGVPDYLESNTIDTDGDGLTDHLDPDSDGDGINDGTEGATTDTDGDGIPDRLESNTKDTDGDGTADSADTDSDGDGINDGTEGAYADSDKDGIPDRFESNTMDTDGDGLVDYLDPDSDGDGLLDGAEGLWNDADSDGIPDRLESNTVDTDGDGTPDNSDTDSDGDGTADGTEGAFADADGDGVPDRLESSTDDTDGDGTNNQLDTDSDGDGRNDGVEGIYTDGNNNGVFDRLEKPGSSSAGQATFDCSLFVGDPELSFNGTQYDTLCVGDTLDFDGHMKKGLESAWTFKLFNDQNQPLYTTNGVIKDTLVDSTTFVHSGTYTLYAIHNTYSQCVYSATKSAFVGGLEGIPTVKCGMDINDSIALKVDTNKFFTGITWTLSVGSSSQVTIRDASAPSTYAVSNSLADSNNFEITASISSSTCPTSITKHPFKVLQGNIEGYGEDSLNPGYSALDILQKNACAKDGVYWIDPDSSSGPNPPFQVFCDMTTDGGGWTLIATGDGSATTLGYYSAVWGSSKPTYNSSDFTLYTGAKVYRSFYEVSGQELSIRSTSNVSGSYLDVEMRLERSNSEDLHSSFNDGGWTVNKPGHVLHGHTWKTKSVQCGCGQNTNYVRFGTIYSSDGCGCGSSDHAPGFGYMMTNCGSGSYGIAAMNNGGTCAFNYSHNHALYIR